MLKINIDKAKVTNKKYILEVLRATIPRIAAVNAAIKIVHGNIIQKLSMPHLVIKIPTIYPPTPK
jgi:hypothetical protein